MTTLRQLLVLFIVAKCFAFTLVIGRPPISNQMVAVTFDQGSAGRVVSGVGALRRKPSTKTSAGLEATLILANQTTNNLLRRRKRDIQNNPCYKRGSFQSFRLSNNQYTFTVACKASTNTGCFNSVSRLTSSICKPKYVVYTATMQRVLQDCTCA